MRILKNLPYLTLLLIAANIAIFLAQPALNPAHDTPQDHFLRVIWPLPHDILERLFSGEVSSTLLVIPGLVTPIFLHANVEHLVGNMVMLLLFGALLEKQIGWKRTLGIYATAGLLAQGLTVLMNVRALGASGAICGVVGAYVVMLVWPPTIWRMVMDRKIIAPLFRIWIGVSSYHMVQGLWLQILSGKPSGEMNVHGQKFGTGDMIHLVGLLIGVSMTVAYLLTQEVRIWKQRAAEKEALRMLPSSEPLSSELPVE